MADEVVLDILRRSCGLLDAVSVLLPLLVLRLRILSRKEGCVDVTPPPLASLAPAPAEVVVASPSSGTRPRATPDSAIPR